MSPLQDGEVGRTYTIKHPPPPTRQDGYATDEVKARACGTCAVSGRA